MNFAIKATISDSDMNAATFEFRDQKTMYGDKAIAVGDTLYMFQSENDGGRGLIACGVVTDVTATPKVRGIARQTPRVSVRVRRTAVALQPFGRDDVKHFRDWDNSKPQTEINFKFYRQATNKIVGISEKTARFLDRFLGE